MQPPDMTVQAVDQCLIKTRCRVIISPICGGLRVQTQIHFQCCSFLYLGRGERRQECTPDMSPVHHRTSTRVKLHLVALNPEPDQHLSVLSESVNLDVSALMRETTRRGRVLEAPSSGKFFLGGSDLTDSNWTKESNLPDNFCL